MVGARKLSAWLVLANYLIANTLAASWHDHHDRTACAAATAHHHHHATHDCATHHDHDCDHADADHDARGHETHDQTNGQEQDTHHCVVCEFLALAPLPAAVPALIDAGEAVPAEVVPPVVRLSATPIQAHPARGPPAAA
jgi:hypothetical protein